MDMTTKSVRERHESSSSPETTDRCDSPERKKIKTEDGIEPPGDGPFPPSPPDRSFPATPPDRAFPATPPDRAFPATPPDRAFPATPSDRAFPATPSDGAFPATPPDGAFSSSPPENMAWSVPPNLTYTHPKFLQGLAGDSDATDVLQRTFNVGQALCKFRNDMTMPDYTFNMDRVMERRRKPGPREKDTYAIYMFCLPNKHAKVPKFTSKEPHERIIITQYQEAGYGFPPADRFDTFSRRTNLSLRHNEEEFTEFIVSLYPVLIGRPFDLHRIDKQRRLIRLETYTPRYVKELKYQGTILVIPYNNDGDRAPAILNRAGEEITIDEHNHERRIFKNGLGALPYAHREGGVLKNGNSKSTPSDRLQNLMTVPQNHCHIPAKNTKVQCLPNQNGAHRGEDCYSDDSLPAASARHTKTTDIKRCVLLESIKDWKGSDRNYFVNKESVILRDDNLFDDVMNLFQDGDMCDSQFDFSVNKSGGTEHSTENAPAVYVLSKFWNYLLENQFEGNKCKIPKSGFDTSSRIDFRVIGRVLAYGLVHCNYFPMQLSLASTFFILTGEVCSDDLLLLSLESHLAEYEWKVIERSRHQPEHIKSCRTCRTCQDLGKILNWYGCDFTPDTSGLSLEQLLRNMGKYLLVSRPHWALSEMRAGFISVLKDFNFSKITESDLLDLRNELELNPFNIFRRIRYSFSDNGDLKKIELKAVDCFERCLLKLTSGELKKFFSAWSGADCLCIDDVSVDFVTDDKLIPEVCANEAFLTLSRFAVNEDRLHTCIRSFCC